jgi:hypothetical protein
MSIARPVLSVLLSPVRRIHLKDSELRICGTCHSCGHSKPTGAVDFFKEIEK